MSKLKRIDEDTDVQYNNLSELSYFDDSGFDVELFVNGDCIGICEVWTDSGDDADPLSQREYLALNNEIVYLENITKL